MRSIFTTRLSRIAAAAAIAGAGLLATTGAEARSWHYYHGGWHGNPAWALNAFAGAVAGAAVASSYYAPRYYYAPPPYRYYAPPAYGYYYAPPPAYGYYGPEPSYGLIVR